MILENLTKRERIILYITFLMGVGALIYIFLMEPFFKEHQRLTQEISLKSLKLRKNLKLIKNKNMILKAYNNLISPLKTSSSTEEVISSLLAEIENKAISSGVYIQEIKPQKPTKKEFFEEFLIELKLKTGISSLAKYLYELISLKKYLKIEKLQISTTRENPSLLKVVIILSGIIF